MGEPDRTLEAALAAVARRPAGLLSDFDGTLSPMVAEPSAARPMAGVSDALRRLSRALEVVGLLTGRAALEARELAGVDQLLIAGNHGVEWLEPGAARPTHDPALDRMPAAIARAFGRVRAGLTALDGIELEDKGVSAAIHYRRAPDPEAARREILEALSRPGEPEMEVREGRMSVELRSTTAGDKGSALRAIVERRGLRGLVVLGDDVTDLDAFRAAAELRAAGRLTAFIGAVQGGDEVPASVAAAADAVVGSPTEVAALLAALADALEGRVSGGNADADDVPR
jgi:trehalose 6-phosphate phosphatase